MGWFAERLLKSGKDADGAARALADKLPADAHSTYSVPRGREAHRKQGAPDYIHHFAYQVPHVWGEPSYSVYRWRVAESDSERITESGYMSHSGEEVLFCCSGNVRYNFHWPIKPLPEGIDVREGTLIRILPHVPHCNTSPGAESWGWMAIRHRSGSTTPMDDLLQEDRPLNGPTGEEHGEEHALSYSRESLSDPTRSLLLLLDIPGKLRVARMRAGLSVAQLAKICEIHPSYIWRLEKGDTNVSIDTLMLIANTVRMDLTDLAIPRYSENSYGGAFEGDLPCQAQLQATPLMDSSVSERPLLRYVPGYEHWFHPHIWELERGGEIAHGVGEDSRASTDFGPEGKCSWIVLAGELLFRPGDSGKSHAADFDDSRARPIVLESGSVLHMRSRASGHMKAIERSRLLRIEYSAICSCADSPYVRRNPGLEAANGNRSE